MAIQFLSDLVLHIHFVKVIYLYLKNGILHIGGYNIKQTIASRVLKVVAGMVIMLAGFISGGCASYAPPSRPFKTYTDRLLSDQKEFYRPRGLLNLGTTAGTAAILANTSADETLYDHYQNQWGQSKSLTDFSAIVKDFGDGQLVIPGMVIGHMMSRTYLDGGKDSWGGQLTERTLRAYLVGAAPLLLAQRVGGSRPQERPGITSSSPWVLGSDTNGASGHAFIGAVPFITAAKMTDSKPAKLAWYALSALPAWSRMHDGAHYPSQVLLGWQLANMSVEAVCRTESDHHFDFTIMPIQNGVYISLAWHF
jgi:hypothetical protein